MIRKKTEKVACLSSFYVYMRWYVYQQTFFFQNFPPQLPLKNFWIRAWCVHSTLVTFSFFFSSFFFFFHNLFCLCVQIDFHNDDTYVSTIYVFHSYLIYLMFIHRVTTTFITITKKKKYRRIIKKNWPRNGEVPTQLRTLFLDPPMNYCILINSTLIYVEFILFEPVPKPSWSYLQEHTYNTPWIKYAIHVYS